MRSQGMAPNLRTASARSWRNHKGSQHDAPIALSDLTGSWRDQKGSTYELTMDSPPRSLTVVTLRPDGTVRSTRALIKQDRHSESIYWGENFVLGTTKPWDGSAPTEVQWCRLNGGKTAFEWYREEPARNEADEWHRSEWHGDEKDFTKQHRVGRHRDARQRDERHRAERHREERHRDERHRAERHRDERQRGQSHQESSSSPKPQRPQATAAESENAPPLLPTRKVKRSAPDPQPPSPSDRSRSRSPARSEPPLPPGWEKHHSTEYDIPYWFNTGTGESRWEPP